MNERTEINIKNLLPHEKPMLMVDAIEHISKEEVTSNFYIDSDCIFLQNDYLSEVALIENAAQTCSAISGQHYFEEETPNSPKVLGFISSIKKINIFSLPKKGTKIQTKAVQISLMQTSDYSICTFHIRVYHLSNVFLEGEMNLFLQRL